ncbi:hypothetical protein Ciccas_011378 [Cichlidogyrus casuarinus]|uniref:Uncharacterized protein n=1 Tax=Cichlidogyrus casuarinus TaxID=1844966 RepID=A0ABD2PTG4_9PLAT
MLCCESKGKEEKIAGEDGVDVVIKGEMEFPAANKEEGQKNVIDAVKKQKSKSPGVNAVKEMERENIGSPVADTMYEEEHEAEEEMTEELQFSLSCTLFLLNTPAYTISNKMHRNSYVKLKQEADDYIDKMQAPEANSACHQDWFQDNKKDETTAYRQVLLAWTVVIMVELTTINDQVQYKVSLPEDHMFSYFSLMGIFAFTNNWKDKVECVTMNDPNIMSRIDKRRKDFAKRYINTKQDGSGETKEIVPGDVEKAEITSDGQLEKLNKYLRNLLEMLLCTKMSQKERLDILTENVGLLSGVRDCYKKQFPEEYKQADEKCLATSEQMKQAYSDEGGVWKAGQILEQVCLDRYRAWKMRSTAMDAQISAIWQMLVLVLLLGLLAKIEDHKKARDQFNQAD